MLLLEIAPQVASVWSKWKEENPQLTDPTVVNNGYCVDFAIEVGQVVPNVKYWSNFDKRFEHVFLEHDGEFYDAECLAGVANYRLMPIWNRIAMLHDVPLQVVTKGCRPISLQQLCKQYGIDFPPRKM